MEQVSSEHFEQLPLARADVPALQAKYRVYSDATNFKRLDASSAVEAMEMSGMANVFKIERESLHKSSLIKPNAPQATVQAEAAPPAN